MIRRHALHAYRIQFPHPITGEELDLRAPLHADMQALLDLLRRRSRSVVGAGVAEEARSR